MHRPVGAQTLRFVLLLLLVLAFLPLEAGAHKGTLDVDPDADSYVYYFPMMYRDAKVMPDLVVESITVNYDSAVVVIKNQGTGPVPSTTSFWVDLYVDPDPMPAGPNDVWDRSSSQGIVWAIPNTVTPTLQAGATLTMTYCPEQEELDPKYWAGYSKFELVAPGTPIAVQVDSANTDTTYGAVLEIHEVFSTTYNNISTTVSIAGSGCGIVQPESAAGLLPLTQADGLPPRRQHAK